MESALWSNGFAALELNPSAAQVEKLRAFVELIGRWNKVYNLTAITNPEQVLIYHIWDSLAILPYLSDGALLDIGSGGGLPGIPIAILRPDLPVTLLDSNSKKTRFMRQVALELSLKNVTVVHARSERWQTDMTYNQVVSRAFASLGDFAKVAGTHTQGRLLAMKGRYPEDEIAALDSQWQLKQAYALAVPGLDAQRYLLVLTRGTVGKLG